MNKIKNAIKWIGTDGLLHFLVCYDYFIQKDNNREQVIHDLICDGVGMGCALLVVLVWWICLM